MRMLLVTNMYPPHHLGGYELSCRDVVERFRARGHHVTILTTTFRKDGVEEVDEPDVRRVLDWYWRDGKPWAPNGRGVLALERHDQRVLRATLDEIHPDVVSMWNMGALPLSLHVEARRRRVPIVHHTCNEWPRLNLEVDGLRALLARRPVVTRVAAALRRLPTRLPDLGASGTFCWVSRAMWVDAERTTPWTFPRSLVVHTGISHDDFPPVPPPSQPRPWRGRLLFVGRVDGVKGVETAIDALSHLPDATLDVVGAGDPTYIRRLLDRARDNGTAGRVRVEEVARQDLRARYDAADALLFTSLHEPFGLVPIEAMARGTPVVATGSGGSAEFLEDGRNCLLFPVGDAAALAAAVGRLADDDDLRLTLVRNGVDTARRFGVDQLADRLEAAHLAAAAGGALRHDG